MKQLAAFLLASTSGRNIFSHSTLLLTMLKNLPNIISQICFLSDATITTNTRTFLKKILEITDHSKILITSRYHASIGITKRRVYLLYIILKLFDKYSYRSLLKRGCRSGKTIENKHRKAVF